MAERKTSDRELTGTRHDGMMGFDVVAHQFIGRVDFSDVGTSGPMETAFQLIGKYLENHTLSQTAASSFSFPGPGEDETIEVTTTSYKENK